LEQVEPIFKLRLGKSGRGGGLSGPVSPFDPGNPIVCYERGYHFRNPLEVRHAVGIREQDDLTFSQVCPPVPRRCRALVGLMDIANRVGLNNIGRTVCGAVIHKDNFIPVPGQGLAQQGIKACINGFFGIVGRNNYGKVHSLCGLLRII